MTDAQLPRNENLSSGRVRNEETGGKNDKQSLENYARKFAFVPYQETAYNKDLYEILGRLGNVYQKYVSTRNEEALETVKQSIEAVANARISRKS